VNDEHDVLRDRGIRLFRFLSQLKQLATVPIRDLSKYEKVLWFSGIPQDHGIHSIAESGDLEADAWLTITRPRLPERPPLPDALAPWVTAASLADFDGSPVLRSQASFEEASSGDEDSLEQSRGGLEWRELGDHPEVEELWRSYLPRWESWSRERQELLPISSTYKDLFEMSQLSQSLGEQFELLVGFGLLVWHTTGASVRRHLVTARADLIFEPRTGNIELRPAAEGSQPRLEEEMLDPLLRPPRQLGDGIRTILEEFGDNDVWDRAQLGPQLASWVHTTSNEGVYLDVDEPPAEKSSPQVAFAPALILRQRTEAPWIDMFAKIVEALETGEGELPVGIRQLVDIIDSGESSADSDGAALDSETYFPLPTNEEQAAIVERVSRSSGVVVQGPPGTGKSHTIANLVSHFLATGQRVLITSHTARALEVVKGKLPSGISDLCVSVTGESRKTLSDLERSAGTIVGTRTTWNREQSVRREQDLRSRLDGRRRRKAGLESELRTIREEETYEHTEVPGGYGGTLAAIATRLAAENSRLGWISSKEASDTSQLSNEEAIELLDLLHETAHATDDAAAHAVLGYEQLPSAEAFSAAVRDEQAARNANEAAKEGAIPEIVNSLRRLSAESRGELVTQTRRLRLYRDELLARPETWVASAVADILNGKSLAWSGRARESRAALEVIDGAIPKATRVRITGVENLDRATIKRQTAVLREHLASGGKLRKHLRGAAQREAGALLENVRIDGGPLATDEDLKSVEAWIQLEDTFTRVEAVWLGDLTLAGPPVVKRDQLDQENRTLEEVLVLDEIALRLRRIWDETPGLPPPVLSDDWRLRGIERGLDSVEADESLKRSAQFFDTLEEVVDRLASSSPSSPFPQQVREAARIRAEESYTTLLYELAEAGRARSEVERRDGLLHRLELHLPTVAADLRATNSDVVWTSRLTNFTEAVDHLRASTWLRAKWSKGGDSTAVRELKSIEDDILATIGELAAELAWRACFDRMTTAEEQHLQAYALAMRKLGKGKGKYANRQRREARSHLDKCQSAIPAWVMPIYRVVETVPVRQDLFDVAIIDEASQSGVEALFLLFLARRIVVVGDDKQISPLDVGMHVADANRLREEFLEGIPHSDLLGPGISFFDQAVLRFGGRLSLREHFRCMPEIIAFSNSNFYSDRPLVPLRQFGANRLEPLKIVHTQDGYTEGGTGRQFNLPEAERLVDQVEKCVADPAYDDKTFGIISLVGDAQAKLISGMLLERIGPQEVLARRLVCGNAYAFQGDERDVMFLSMVSAPSVDRTLRAFTTLGYAQRFNVAASRAKDQMWLFHTATLNDLSPECFRHKLIRHFLTPAEEFDYPRGKDVTPDVLVAPFDSLFEQRVFIRLRDRGYRVIPQYELHGKRIDLVITGGAAKIAVECDGEDSHTAADREKDDARQRDLERAGMQFERIRESRFYLDPDDALADLYETLDKRNIRPSGFDEPDEAVRSDREVPDTASAWHRDLREGRSPSVVQPGSDDDAQPEAVSHALHVVTDEASDDPGEVSIHLESIPEISRGVPVSSVEDIAPSGSRALPTNSPSEVDSIVSTHLDADRRVLWPSKREWGLDLAQYDTWNVDKPLPDPRSASRRQNMESLEAVVRVEGPILAERAYRQVVRSAAGHRVTRVVAEALNRSSAELARTGRLTEERPSGSTGQADWILRLPGMPVAVLRVRGDRSFEEIPESEVVSLASQLLKRHSRLGDDDVKRAMLDIYDLKRLTTKVSSLLDHYLQLARWD
jgi:very-short-patch-repair endonuclease